MHLISPEKIFRGNNAWLNSILEIKKISKRPLILGRSLSTKDIRYKIYKDLEAHNFNIYTSNLHLEYSIRE